MNKFLIAGVTAAGLAFGAASANAALLQVNGGTASITPPDGGGIIGNQIFPGTPGVIGGQLVALSSVTLTFTFVGKEASWLDNFYVGGVQVFQNQTSAVGTTYTTTVGAGVIDLSWLLNVNLADGLLQTLLTNASPSSSGPTVFWGRCDKTGASTADTGETFCSSPDDGGAGPDDNHDDLVVSVSAVPAVPEPASIAIFGAALAGLGLLRRRRSA